VFPELPNNHQLVAKYDPQKQGLLQGEGNGKTLTPSEALVAKYDPQKQGLLL